MERIVLARKNGKEPVEILAAFLSTVPAILKYGRTTIYTDDTYYIPYRRKVFLVRETGEEFQLLCSCVSENIAVMALPGSCNGQNFSLETIELPEENLVAATRSMEDTDREIQQQMQLDHTIRKVLRRCHLEESVADQVYIAEQTFCVHGKSDYIFLVDPVSEKVDLSNFDSVQKIIAQKYLQKHPELLLG